jgi:S-formylglutathione hydrolase FrmB
VTAAVSVPAAGRVVALWLALLASVSFAAAVPRVDDVPSRLTKGPVRTAVLLPPSYESTPARRYPVLYFLHDGRGDERTLFARGIADMLLDDMKSGKIPELLVVSPRLGGTWCADSYDGKNRYASFLDKELVPFVDARYRTLGGPRTRAVAGISMGGYGAIHWALLDPELFAAAGGLSPALQQLSWHMLDPLPFLARFSMTRVFGKRELANNFTENDVYQMLLRDPRLAPRVPPVVVRCGTEDRYRLAPNAAFFGRFLHALSVPNEVTVEAGGHDWAYWSRVLQPLLRSVAAHLPGAGT